MPSHRSDEKSDAGEGAGAREKGTPQHQMFSPRYGRFKCRLVLPYLDVIFFTGGVWGWWGCSVCSVVGVVVFVVGTLLCVRPMVRRGVALYDGI